MDSRDTSHYIDGGASSLRLAGTVGPQADLLQSPGALGRWLAGAGVAEPEAQSIALRLPDFLALRTAIRDCLERAVVGGSLPPASVEVLNATSGTVANVLALEASGAVPVAVERPASGSAPAAALLAGFARSAIALLGGQERERLRACRRARCGRYFVAARPSQVWCSPSCGNRARVARHHERAARRRRPPPFGPPERDA